MDEQLAVSYECTPVVEKHVNPDGTSPAVTVIEAVSEAAGVDQTELPPLCQAIDPAVINKLVASAEGKTGVTAGLCFTYNGWNVFVRADGTIIIGDSTEKIRPTPLF